MDISSLSTLFTAPAISDAKPAEKKGNDDSICTRILNAVKSALAFFVSCLTCGKVKVFEGSVVPKPASGVPKGSDPVWFKELEEAAITLGIPTIENVPLELHAFMTMVETLQKMAAPGEDIHITADKAQSTITVGLPSSLKVHSRDLSLIAGALIESFSEELGTSCIEFKETRNSTILFTYSADKTSKSKKKDLQISATLQEKFKRLNLKTADSFSPTATWLDILGDNLVKGLMFFEIAIETAFYNSSLTFIKQEKEPRLAILVTLTERSRDSERELAKKLFKACFTDLGSDVATYKEIEGVGHLVFNPSKVTSKDFS